MTDNHPITPPPELVAQWRRGGPADAAVNNAYERHIATQAANWGADMELEACKEWVSWRHSRHESDELLFARRPQPPSLKAQSLAALNEIEDKMLGPTIQEKLIRRALESLPD